MNLPPNRVVAIATPLVFAPLAGAITALAAKHAPGVDIDQDQLQAIFIAGATIAVAKAGFWMKGWQEAEKRQEVMPSDALEPANSVSSLAAGGESDMDLAADADADAELQPDTSDPSLDDEDSEEAPDDLMAEMEAALAETADAQPAGKV